MKKKILPVIALASLLFTSAPNTSFAAESTKEQETNMALLPSQTTVGYDLYHKKAINTLANSDNFKFDVTNSQQVVGEFEVTNSMDEIWFGAVFDSATSQATPFIRLNLESQSSGKKIEWLDLYADVQGRSESSNGSYTNVKAGTYDILVKSGGKNMTVKGNGFVYYR